MFHFKPKTKEDDLAIKIHGAAQSGKSVRISGKEAVELAIAFDKEHADMSWLKKPTTYVKDGKTYTRYNYICPHCGKSEVFESNYCRFCGHHMMSSVDNR